MTHSFMTTLAAGCLALALGPAAALAQAPAPVGVVTTLTGEATVARAALPAPAAVRFRDPVFARDRISTGEKSIVRVLLGGKALVTARELSVLTISESPLRSTVTLDAGKVAASVIKARMQPGEVIEFRTPNAVAVVRGTVLVVEVTQGAAPADGGPAPVTTTVSVINGLVDVFSLAAPNVAPVRVGGQESVKVSGDRLGTLRTMTKQESVGLTADLEVAPNQQQPHAKEVPATLRRSIGATEQAKAAAVAGLLAPSAKGGTAALQKPVAAIDKTVDATVDTMLGVPGKLTDVDSALLEATSPLLGGVGKVDGAARTTTTSDGAAGPLGQGAVGGAMSGATNGAGAVVGGATGGVGALGGGVTGGLGGATGGVGGAVGGVTGGVGGAVGGVTGGVGGRLLR